MIHLALWIASLLFLAWVGFNVFLLLLKLSRRILYEFREAWSRRSQGFKTSIIVTFGLAAAYLLWTTAPAVSGWFQQSPHARDILIGLAVLTIARLVGSSLRTHESPPPRQIQGLQRQVRLHDLERRKDHD